MFHFDFMMTFRKLNIFCNYLIIVYYKHQFNRMSKILHSCDILMEKKITILRCISGVEN